MRRDKPSNNARFAFPLAALGAFAAIIALAGTAQAAPRFGGFGGFGGSGAKMAPIGALGGSRGIIGKPVRIGGSDGGRLPGGNHDGNRPRPYKPLILIPSGIAVGTVAATGVSAAPINKGSGGPSSGNGVGGSGGLPPAGELRYVPDEVLVQHAATMSATAVDALLRRTRLTRVESFTTGSVTMSRWRIPDGRPVPDVIRSLQGLVLAAQPNYLYRTEGERPASEAEADADAEKGEHWQYALAKLNLPQAHALAKGEQVLIAVIDSGIDGRHPELDGVIAGSFDALEADEPPHPHGTAIAGAIVAHSKLMGTAPQARILAARAFSAKARSLEATTYSVSRSLDWAIGRGARIINMSFSGPRDPAIEQRVQRAGKQGIVLIAAAGNGGPKAEEAYPGAYASVIAVTATDAEDKLFPKANRGRYIAVAAPGVDVLLPGPEATYQVASGTSFAAAEVSGIAALMLERKADLGSEGVRRALMATARDLGPKGFDREFGAGLVDAYRAIRAVEPAIVTTGVRPSVH